MKTSKTIFAALCVAALAFGSGTAMAGDGKGKGDGGGRGGGHHGPVVKKKGHHHGGGFVFGSPFVGGVFVGHRCWYQRATVWDSFLHAYVVRTVKVCG